MADEAPEEIGGGGGSALKKYGPLALIVLVAQVVLAWVVLTVAVGDRLGGGETDEPLMPEDEITTDAGEVESDELPFLFISPELEKITANPAGTNAQRYAVVSVQLGLAGDKKGEAFTPEELLANTGSQELIVKNIGLVKNILLNKLRASYIDELESDLTGIMEEVKDQINQEVFSRIKWDKDGEVSIRVKVVVATELIIQ